MDPNDPRLVDLEETIRMLRTEEDEEKKQASINALHQTFRDNVQLADQLGPVLHRYGGAAQEREPPRPSSGMDLFFCGFVEGDYSERVRLTNPIAYSGGFLLRTTVTDILFDPGMGTIRALDEHGFSLDRIGIVVVSHYHPSASSELHTLLNTIGKGTPLRFFPGERDEKRKVDLFTTEAVAVGRNHHPSLLIPSDWEKLNHKPEDCVRKPGHWWVITVSASGILEQRSGSGSPATALLPRRGLLIRTLPGSHNEAAMPHDKGDASGLAGDEVSCYYVRDLASGASVLFTGDTAYEASLFAAWEMDLKEQVTVLVANTKTLAYLRKIDRTGSPRSMQYGRLRWDNMPETWNQLGWAGTLQLTQALRPKALVMRAFGLECVIREGAPGKYEYAPERMAVCRQAMITALSGIVSADRVYIPGRLHLLVARHEARAGARIAGNSVDAFPDSGIRTYAGRFKTTNDMLIRDVDFHVARLKGALSANLALQEDLAQRRAPVSDPAFEPAFLVIQGGTGWGKTCLAEAMGEILRGFLQSELHVRSRVSALDLATTHTNTLMRELFGSIGFANSPACDGLFAEPGVVVLNQLEKLDPALCKALLEVLEKWQYSRVGEGGSVKLAVVQPAVIFTTNVDIVDTEFTPDVKFRLLRQCISIPDLSKLPRELRDRELGAIVDQLCETNSITLDHEARRFLVTFDWSSHGAMRALRNVVLRAKDIGLLKFPSAYRARKSAPSEVYCHVSGGDVDAAFKQVVGVVTAGVPVPLDEKALWYLLSLLVNNTLTKTYACLRSPYARAAHKCISGPLPFKTGLGDILARLAPFKGDTERLAAEIGSILDLRTLQPKITGDADGALQYLEALENVGTVKCRGPRGNYPEWRRVLTENALDADGHVLPGWLILPKNKTSDAFFADFARRLLALDPDPDVRTCAETIAKRLL